MLCILARDVWKSYLVSSLDYSFGKLGILEFCGKTRLTHALGLDHHDALLISRANVLKHAKTEGFFQQRELRKTYTAREVCVGMAG